MNYKINKKMLPDHLLDDIYLGIFIQKLQQVNQEYHEKVTMNYAITTEDDPWEWERDKYNLLDNNDHAMIGYRNDQDLYVPYDDFIVYCEYKGRYSSHNLNYRGERGNCFQMGKFIFGITQKHLGPAPYLLPKNYYYTYPTLDSLKKVLDIN